MTWRALWGSFFGSFFWGVVFASFARAADLPHIVYILADDLGYGDVGCYNEDSKISTPSIDRLARQGVRLTNAHSPSSVCSPTRYAVLTGRYCWRTVLDKSVLDGFDPPLIDAGRLTVPALLKRRGYATACLGKWHLGMTWRDAEGAPLPLHRLPGRSGQGVDFARAIEDGPLTRGFDRWFGISASLDMSPYCWIENERVVQPPSQSFPGANDMYMGIRDGVIAPDFRHEETLPTLGRKAVELVESHAVRRPAQPLFLYLPLPAPHLPVVPTRDFEGRSMAGRYGDFVVQTDHVVGEVLDALENAGMAENTLVILTSDNGGVWHWWDPEEADDVAHHRENDRSRLMRTVGHRGCGALRGNKADIWEGGHRVPFVARWPGRIPAARVSDALTELTDLMATCAAIVGETLPDDAGEDSYNGLPALAGVESLQPVREAAVHHSLHGMFAIRRGPWKLILGRGSGGFSEPRFLTPGPGEPTGQLYHLERDPRETQNVWARHPDIVEALSSELEKYRSSGRSAPRS